MMPDRKYEQQPHVLVHPEWAAAIGQVEKPTIFVNTALVPHVIYEFAKKVGFGDREKIAVFSKACSPAVIDALPTNVMVFASAGDFMQVARNHPKREIGLHFGRPNDIDMRFGFTTPARPIELRAQMLAAGMSELEVAKAFAQVSTIVLDGQTPNGIPFDAYVRELRSVDGFPHAKISMKALIDVSTYNLRHGQSRGIPMTQIPQELSHIPGHHQGGWNMYMGNPLTADMISVLTHMLLPPDDAWKAEKYHSPRVFIVDNDGNPIPDPDNGGKQLAIPFPARIHLGGFGGFGDEVPYDAINEFVRRVKEYSTYTEIIFELGTYLAERCSVIAFPKGVKEQQIADFLPDANHDRRELRTKQTKGGLAVTRMVAYGYTQLELPVEVFIA